MTFKDASSINDKRGPVSDNPRLSEDAAHRLLARAIELEQSRDIETSLAELREVAHDAGISLAAFDEAARELIAKELSGDSRAPGVERQSRLGRAWRWLRGSFDGKRTIGPTVGANVLAAVASWIVMFVLVRVVRGTPWWTTDAMILLGCILGAGIAWRLRARVAQIVLLGFVAWQAAEFVMHLIYGIRSVQSGPTHFAVMAAGILGAGIAWTARSIGGGVPLSREVRHEQPGSEEGDQASGSSAADRWERVRSLRLTSVRGAISAILLCALTGATCNGDVVCAGVGLVPRTVPADTTIQVGASFIAKYQEGGGCDRHVPTDADYHTVSATWQTQDTAIVRVDSMSGRVTARTVGDAKVGVVERSLIFVLVHVR